ncbi:MAG: hypothetical protein WC340_16695 [Kiritimatiellia bacterium]
MNWAAQQLQKARKVRQNISAFKRLIAAPASGAVVLPASGRFALRSNAPSTPDTVAAIIVGANTRTIKTLAMSAGTRMTLDHIERGCVVTPSANFDLLLDTGFGVFVKIAGGA